MLPGYSSQIVPLTSIMMGAAALAGWFVHYTQHRWAAGFEETPDEQPGENQKSQVQPGRVIPGDGGLDHARFALRRDERKAAEDQIDNKRRDCHRNVKGSEQEARHLQPVILAINVQDWEDDEVGEDEGDHPAEADAAVPQ